jgi:predicted Zn-dependent peptidase
LWLAIAVGAPLAGAQDIPSRPEEISFGELSFEPPKAADFRHQLSNGVAVYLAESHEFPLINVRFFFRGGSYLEPAEKAGLAGMTGSMIRRGGTTSLSAEDLDEEFDFLAANCSTSSGAASLNCLKSNFDQSFRLFLDMLRNPGFQSDKVGVYRDQRIEAMKQRNDDAGSILGREWDFLLYGMEHHEGRVVTQDTLAAIGAADLHGYHQRVFQPGNLIIAVNGDFDSQEMLARLEQAMEGWQVGERMPPPPAPSQQFASGVYHVEKDIPQGKVFLGMRSVTRDHPDYYILQLMNDILGGGGFTSRITSRVRSDEGLAYSAGSSLSMPTYYPGEFRASFQSKNRTVALAIKVILEEVARIREEKVSGSELETAKNAVIETFPRRFESKAGTLGTFVNDEWTGREDGYWNLYREKIKAVSADDILRAAQSHLQPEDMAIMVVGKWGEIEPGDLDGRAKMGEFFSGKHTEIPLRDPLTMEIVSN